jgi:hypothetical protein
MTARQADLTVTYLPVRGASSSLLSLGERSSSMRSGVEGTDHSRRKAHHGGVRAACEGCRAAITHHACFSLLHGWMGFSRKLCGHSHRSLPLAVLAELGWFRAMEAPPAAMHVPADASVRVLLAAHKAVATLALQRHQHIDRQTGEVSELSDLQHNDMCIPLF